MNPIPPFRSGDRNTLDWQRTNQLSELHRYTRTEVINLRADKRRGPNFSFIEFFPFKLYRLPFIFRDTPDPTTDWRKFRVRGGRVLGADATQTDGAANADIPDFPAGTEVEVPDTTEKFWFWIEVNGADSVVRWSDDPTDTDYSGSPSWSSDNPWTTAPVPDEKHIPIGWVDTNTRSDEKVAIVRQLLRTDVVTVGGGGGFSTYRLKSVAANYLVCKTWDGSDGEDDVKIAKPYKLRESITAATFFAGTANERNATYAYAAGPDSLNRQRTYSDDVGITEIQMVFPVWIVNDLIYALPGFTGVVDGDDAPVSLLMIGESRQWGRIDAPE